MNWLEFLVAGMILISIFFLLLILILGSFINKFAERVCSMLCREFKNSYYHKFDYENLKCECCKLVNGSLECESV